MRSRGGHDPSIASRRAIFGARHFSRARTPAISEPLQRLTIALAERYRVDHKIGEGGMATVHLALDLKHGRRVALKVLHPELAAVLVSRPSPTRTTTSRRTAGPSSCCGGAPPPTSW
ncbi:MAG TPA: hypothetical protein VJ817_14845 [Gemmatimonadales bacterium]|nr:hypothetical protein [Gemmatimonadales bacterium]